MFVFVAYFLTPAASKPAGSPCARPGTKPGARYIILARFVSRGGSHYVRIASYKLRHVEHNGRDMRGTNVAQLVKLA